jgi:hypothetical protein
MSNRSMSAVQITTNRRSISSPLEIGTCALWFDASDSGTISLSGSSVTQWNDKSGNGRNFSNTTGLNQPTYSATGFNSSYPTLTFSSSYLTRTISGTASSLYTAFFVIEGTTTSAQYLFDALTGRFAIAQNEAVGTGVYNGGTWYSVGPARAGLQIYSFVCTAGGGLFRNGSRFGTIATFPGLAINGANAIGARYSLDSNFLDGKMSEFILFNVALSDGNRQLVESYLATKWGMISYFPFNHPVRIIPSISFNKLNGFSPRDIPGITLWLDAADSSTLTGSPVTTWRDKSGAGNNATSSAGPTQSTYLGYPVVSFNGTSQYMTSANTLPTQTHTLIAVHRPAVLNGYYQGNTSLFRYQVSNYVVFPYMFETSPKGYITNFDTTAIDYSNSTLLENSITTDFNIIMAVISSGSQKIYKNGTLQNSTAYALTSGTTNTLNIGSLGGSTEFYQGSLGEMIVYRYNISDLERQEIEGYLAWKWGLQASLPSDHPYRNGPPFLPTAVTTNIPLGIKMSAAFSPTSIPGMNLWLDAADAGTVLLSGSDVTGVYDKSSNAYVLSNGTGFTYNQTKFNGTYPSFYSPVTSTNCIGIISSLSMTQPVSAFTVAQAEVAAGVGIYIFDSIGTLGTQRLIWVAQGSASPSALTSNAIWGGTAYISGSSSNVFIGSAIYNTTASEVFANGNRIGSGSIGTNTMVGFTFGNRFNFAQGWSGHICETILYTGNVGATQRQKIEGYLAWKWGLVGNLPATHPFKLFPPPP